VTPSKDRMISSRQTCCLIRKDAPWWLNPQWPDTDI
jgi:hypothetical protein